MSETESLIDSHEAGESIDGGFPHCVHADPGAADFERWFAREMPRLEPALLRAGALLFRGFPLREPEDFRRAVAAMAPQLRGYAGGTSPRSRVAEGIYTSTEYPKQLEIPLHKIGRAHV